MLPHYSAFKVAEVFPHAGDAVPGAHRPGHRARAGQRPDYGGGAVLSRPQLDIRHYPIVVRDLLNFLNDTVDDEHPFASLHAGPGEFTAPDVWLLGSRADSAAMAAEMGLPFSFAHFFGLATEHGPAIAEMYRQNFKPSEYLAEPKVNVAFQVLCAETEEDAKRISSSRNLSRVRSVQGQRRGRAANRGGAGV